MTCCPSGRGAGCTSCARPKCTPSGTTDPTYPATAGCSPCIGPSRVGSRPASPSASSWRGCPVDSLILPEGSQVQDQSGGAAPHLFTFLRYPNMPPHNNGAELEIRDTAVLRRNVRHQLSTAARRELFSVLVSMRAPTTNRASFHGPQ